MNAIQFIKEHGVEKAREVVEGAPEGSTHFVGLTYLKLIGAVWWNAWLPEWSHKDNRMVKKWKCESIELMKTWGEVYKLDELKRLVESIGLVNKLGGIAIAKEKLAYGNSISAMRLSYETTINDRNGTKQNVITGVYLEDLEQAIADYESIGGEHV